MESKNDNINYIYKKKFQDHFTQKILEAIDYIVTRLQGGSD